MGFELEPSRARVLVPMYNTILRAKTEEACLLGCQNFQIIKTSMMLIPVRGWGSHVEDDPEAPVIYSVFHSTGKWDVAPNCIWLFLIFGFLLAMAGWILDDLNDLHPCLVSSPLDMGRICKYDEHEVRKLKELTLTPQDSWLWKEEEKEQWLGEWMPCIGCI